MRGKKNAGNPELAFYFNVDLSRFTLGIDLKYLHHARVAAEKLPNFDSHEQVKK
jgi:hypothetical protein